MDALCATAAHHTAVVDGRDEAVAQATTFADASGDADMLAECLGLHSGTWANPLADAREAWKAVSDCKTDFERERDSLEALRVQLTNAGQDASHLDCTNRDNARDAYRRVLDAFVEPARYQLLNAVRDTAAETISSLRDPLTRFLGVDSTDVISPDDEYGDLHTDLVDQCAAAVASLAAWRRQPMERLSTARDATDAARTAADAVFADGGIGQFDARPLATRIGGSLLALRTALSGEDALLQSSPADLAGPIPPSLGAAARRLLWTAQHVLDESEQLLRDRKDTVVLIHDLDPDGDGDHTGPASPAPSPARGGVHNPKDAFLSHAWADKSAVMQHVAVVLERHGLSCWLDLNQGAFLRRSVFLLYL